jgi:hypothetical protein
MGGAATWWWDNYVHPLNLYHEFTPLARFAARIPWADRAWEDLEADAVLEGEGEETYADLTVPANFGWGRLPGEAVFTPRPNGKVEGGPLPQYLYSAGKADLRVNPRFTVVYGKPGRFSVRVQQVMGNNRLRILLDGRTALEQELPAGKGEGPWKQSEYQPEWDTYRATYDREFEIEVPAGRHAITVENAGGDWIQVSDYRLSGYRSSRYPAVRALGLRSGRRAVLWVQDEASHWKAAREGGEPRRWDGLSLRLRGMPAGTYRVTWWDTRRGRVIREDMVRTASGPPVLSVPPFRRDLAADLRGAPR